MEKDTIGKPYQSPIDNPIAKSCFLKCSFNGIGIKKIQNSEISRKSQSNYDHEH